MKQKTHGKAKLKISCCRHRVQVLLAQGLLCFLDTAFNFKQVLTLSSNLLVKLITFSHMTAADTWQTQKLRIYSDIGDRVNIMKFCR